MLAHEDSIPTLLYLRSQKFAECTRHNLDCLTSMINKHIHLTYQSLRSNRRPHRWRQL